MEPNPFHHPPSYSFTRLPTRTPVVRVYNHAEALRPPIWTALDFNPNPVDPDSRKQRGRFSSTTDEPYAFMYVGMGKDGLSTALWEMLEFEGYDSQSGVFSLPPRLVQEFAIAEMETTRSLFIVNIRDQPELVPFLALRAALISDDYQLSRRWGRYIRRVAGRAIDGLRYHSIKAGKNNALVLFEPLSVANERPRRTPRAIRRTKRSALLRDRATLRRVADVLRMADVAAS
jgi:hypothetical protein